MAEVRRRFIKFNVFYRSLSKLWIANKVIEHLVSLMLHRRVKPTVGNIEVKYLFHRHKAKDA